MGVKRQGTKSVRTRRSRMQQEIADYHSSTSAPNGITANGQHCIIHTPTLEELQSTTFSNYVRNTVLPAAAVYELKREAKQDYYMGTAMELHEGIAKVRLPAGFFPSAPYGDDTTGRGDLWQAGTVLGDWPLTSPIQENIRGMAGVYEYTHTELPATTLSAFRDRADKYRKEQMGSVMLEFKNEDGEEGDAERSNTDGGKSSSHEETAPVRPGELTEAQVATLERQFWKRLSPTMPPAVYGADEAGTLFGDDPASGWSLAKLDSCLHVLSDIPGVTSPYLYAGMWATVFCAHAEDMNLLSINYLHAGQPKLWYAIAEPDAARFVSLAEHHYIHQLKKCKEFLRHKRCLLSPAILKKAGIRYQTAIQYPGDAIITFPGGYHFGFNAGFNMAEATNFGVPEWLPFGRRAKVCLCRPDSVRIDMNRLTVLLQRCQKDQKRNRRLTWKEWRKRQERKEGLPSRDSIEETADEIIEVISYTPKKRKLKKKDQLSEQQRKNEFWIEVMQPSEFKKSGKKHGAKRAKESPWHLAKPISRKRLEVQMRVLCLVPAATKTLLPVPRDYDDSSDEEKDVEEDEQCFACTIVEMSQGHVLVHFDGLPKTEDIWMPESSPKLFLDGGRWQEEHEEEGMPPLHYWKEMDSKTLTK
jgi:JmjC domain, hydroxylase